MKYDRKEAKAKELCAVCLKLYILQSSLGILTTPLLFVS